MPLALKRSDQTVSDRPSFSGNMLDMSEIWSLTRPKNIQIGALARYNVATPSQRHTSNSAREFATELVVGLAATQWVSSSLLKNAARIRGITPRIANKSSTSTLSEWVAHLNESQSEDVGEISKTLSLLLDRLQTEGHGAIDSDLRNVDVERSHPYHLLATLRTLFKQRHAIPSWKDLERRTREQFEKQDLKPSRVMKGLDIDDKIRTAK
jgi:hypothetical protein